MMAADVTAFLSCADDEATACLKPEKLPVTKINWAYKTYVFEITQKSSET